MKGDFPRQRLSCGIFHAMFTSSEQIVLRGLFAIGLIVGPPLWVLGWWIDKLRFAYNTTAGRLFRWCFRKQTYRTSSVDAADHQKLSEMAN